MLPTAFYRHSCYTESFSLILFSYLEKDVAGRVHLAGQGHDQLCGLRPCGSLSEAQQLDPVKRLTCIWVNGCIWHSQKLYRRHTKRKMKHVPSCQPYFHSDGKKGRGQENEVTNTLHQQHNGWNQVFTVTKGNVSHAQEHKASLRDSGMSDR